MSQSQNIYDNQTIFDGYYALRERDDCYNDLLEQPAMTELIPDIQGKLVLDLGCGYGYNCMDFVRRGAKEVTGIDISQKMLEVAQKESCNSKIDYINMSMTDIDKLDKSYDLVYSSLAFHYIEDFDKLISDIYSHLNIGGHLIYSQEHPIITATLDGTGHFNKNENGDRVSYTFSNYNQSGIRKSHWFIDGVVKYHRPMGEILTTIAKAGFIIEKVIEPTPKPWAIEKLPTITKEFLKPNFLLIKARRA